MIPTLAIRGDRHSALEVSLSRDGVLVGDPLGVFLKV